MCEAKIGVPGAQAVKNVRKRVRTGSGAPETEKAPARRLKARKRHRDQGRSDVVLKTRKTAERKIKAFGRGIKQGTAMTDPLAGNYVDEQGTAND